MSFDQLVILSSNKNCSKRGARSKVGWNMGAGITRLSGWGQVSSWFGQVEKVVDKMSS
jgi:hypothetical protein